MLSLPENPAVNLFYRVDPKGRSYEVLVGYDKQGQFVTCEESNTADIPNLRVTNQSDFNHIRNALGNIFNGQIRDIKIFVEDKELK